TEDSGRELRGDRAQGRGNPEFREKAASGHGRSAETPGTRGAGGICLLRHDNGGSEKRVWPGHRERAENTWPAPGAECGTTAGNRFDIPCAPPGMSKRFPAV